jgi:hypothetical protein
MEESFMLLALEEPILDIAAPLKSSWNIAPRSTRYVSLARRQRLTWETRILGHSHAGEQLADLRSLNSMVSRTTIPV